MTTPSGHWWEGVTCTSRAVWPPPVDCEAPRSSHRESPGHEPGVKPRTTRRVVHAIPFNSESGREPRASAVGGYAVLEAKSRDEALHAARTFMRLHQQHWPGWEGECEIRQLCFLAP